MNKDQACELLGVSASSDAEAIAAAYEAKRRELQSRIEAAPTDALKAKFQQTLDELADARDALGSQPASGAGMSALSQTKLDDLPGAAPQMTQMGEQAAAQLHIKPGDMLAGRYQIKEQIGAGGMGAVYRAHDGNRGEDIAIKVLLPSLTRNERALSRFLDEARLSSKLSHPNIVNVFDVQNDGELSFITMELLEGTTLRQLMDNRKLARQPFAENEALEIANSLSNALGYAHQHTVHRDIKPENIFLTEDGDYKVMDFGIARLMSTSARTQTGAAMGTAYYMAPEQLRGAKDVDGRADQYSVAVLLYELLTGEVPAGMIKPLREQRKEISKGFSAAVGRAMANQPQERFDDIAAFTAALGKQGGGISLPSLSPKAMGIAAGLVLVVGAAAGLSQMNLGALQDLMPMGSEERQAIKNEALTLQGKAKSLKQRVDTAVRSLAQRVKDSENELKRLESSLRTARDDVKQVLRDELETVRERLVREEAVNGTVQNVLLGGAILVDLESRQGLGDAQVRDKEYEQARSTLGDVVEAYQRLLASTEVAPSLYTTRNRAIAAKQVWDGMSKDDEALQQSPPSQQALDAYNGAESARSQGDFVAANTGFQTATDGFQNLAENVPLMIQAESGVVTAKARWDQYARENGYQELAAAKSLEESFKLALDQKGQGQYAEAASGFETAGKEYQGLLNAVMGLEENQLRSERELSALRKLVEKEKISYADPLTKLQADYDKAQALRTAGDIAQAALLYASTADATSQAKDGIEGTLAYRTSYRAQIKRWKKLGKRATEADKKKVGHAKKIAAEAASELKAATLEGSGKHYQTAAKIIDDVVDARNGAIAKARREKKRQEAEARKRRKHQRYAKLAEPDMVRIPGGSFRMGDLDGKGDSDEKPVHTVQISAFNLGKYEITRGQYAQFVAATGYRTKAERDGSCYDFNGKNSKWEYIDKLTWREPGYTTADSHPVVCVDKGDAEAFAKWLSKYTNHNYRLPTEAEMEYAMRAGTSSRYFFGNDYDRACEYGNVGDETEAPDGNHWTNRAKCNDGYGHTAPVGRFRPNGYGLYDILGNVKEWTQDCWNEGYVGAYGDAPTDGSAWRNGACDKSATRGGSWSASSSSGRSAYRTWSGNGFRGTQTGFRLVRY